MYVCVGERETHMWKKQERQTGSFLISKAKLKKGRVFFFSLCLKCVRFCAVQVWWVHLTV